ncbi:hypothetical protein ACLKA7_005449 [Drosophila subpalustris]
MATGPRCGSLAKLAGQKEITWQRCGSQKDPLATLAGQKEITWQRCGSQKDPLATLASRESCGVVVCHKTNGDSKFECGRVLPTEPYNSHDNHSSAPALLESAYKALLRSNNSDPSKAPAPAESAYRALLRLNGHSSAPAPTESAYRALLRLNGHSSAPALLESAYRALLRRNNSDPSSAPALWRGRIEPCSAATTASPAAHQRQQRVRTERPQQRTSANPECVWSLAPASTAATSTHSPRACGQRRRLFHHVYTWAAVKKRKSGLKRNGAYKLCSS